MYSDVSSDWVTTRRGYIPTHGLGRSCLFLKNELERYKPLSMVHLLFLLSLEDPSSLTWLSGAFREIDRIPHSLKRTDYKKYFCSQCAYQLLEDWLAILWKSWTLWKRHFDYFATHYSKNNYAPIMLRFVYKCLYMVDFHADIVVTSKK